MEDVDMNNEWIVWNDTEYKLKFVLDNPNFNLPQIVRVVQGHMVDEDDSIASGQVLTLHGKKRSDAFLGTDEHGKDLNIPFSCPYKVRIVSLGNPRRFTSVRELCFCEHPPKFVRLEDSLETGDGIEALQSWSTLEIMDHVIGDENQIIGLNCRVPDFNEPSCQERRFVLPVHLNGVFMETIETDLVNKSFLLAELYEEHSLPFQVQFLPVSERNCGYGPQLGEIRLEKKLSINSILATSVIDGVRHAMTFSADLPITIQVAEGLVNNRPQSTNNRSHGKIDLTRFDYMSTNNPYTSCELQNQVYDELRTPLLPRHEPTRHEQILRRHNSNINDYSFSRKSSKSLDSSSTIQTTHDGKKRNKTTHDGKKRNNSLDIEKFVKSKLSLKSLKKFKSKSKSKCDKMEDKNMQRDFDTQSTSTFLTSDDGSSSTGLCSIDIRSSGSDSAFNSSFHHIEQCMDALSLDNQSVPHIKRRHSRNGSSDSGICLSGRKQNRSRSRSRLTPETASSNAGDHGFDNLSEWSIPVPLKRSPMSERNMTSRKMSANYLWSADSEETDNINNNNNSNNTSCKHDAVGTNSSFMTSNYPSQSDGSKTEDSTVSAPSPFTAAQRKSIEEIRKYSEEGVCRILESLKLEEFKNSFQENQINGELLIDLEVDDLVNELKLSLFQAKKIMKYVKGWRPELGGDRPSQTSRRNSLNPRDWSESDVYIHLITINLIDLASFCQRNQVNGELLLDILDKDTLMSLKNDHGVNMSNIESKKLLNFVVKGWRPDSSPKKAAAL